MRKYRGFRTLENTTELGGALFHLGRNQSIQFPILNILRCGMSERQAFLYKWEKDSYARTGGKCELAEI